VIVTLHASKLKMNTRKNIKELGLKVYKER
jgi:hypothetical protein